MNNILEPVKSEAQQPVSSQSSEREAFLDAVLDNLIDGVVVLEREEPMASSSLPTFRVVFANREACSRLGEEHLQSAEQLFERWNTKFGIDLRDLCLRCWTTRENHLLDVHALDDPSHWEKLSLSVLDHRIVVLFSDISQQRRDQHRMVEAKERAERAAMVKSQFLATMSHEIRTPMNGTLGMIELLLDEELTQEQRELAEGAHESTASLLRIINDVLDFSKNENFELKIVEEAFSIRELLSTLEAVFEKRVEGKDVEYLMSIEDDIADVLVGDPGRLQQVLVNLVGNAIKFTPSCGIIYVRVEKIGEDEGAQHIQFSVADSGIGIPKEKLSTIFQPFSQVDPSLSRAYGGTGLGLSISRDLVRAMNGDLTVTSVEGIGSRFRFQLHFPVAQVTALDQKLSDVSHPKEIEESFPTFAPNDVLILVAEDNAVNQKIVTKLLEKYGCRYLLAENGQEAVELFRAHGEEISLVLMDIQMPVMTGIEATRRIRAMSDPPGQEMPILALTAHVLEEDRATFLEAGMNEIIGKPINRQALFEQISRLIERNDQGGASS
ncbi:ATP-binding protein [bacterium]|nr:ATP-binding protein [bacterium]